MMNNATKALRLAQVPLSVAVVSLGLSACDGGGDEGIPFPPAHSLVSIQVTEAPLSMLAKAAKGTPLPMGLSQRYIATGTYSYGATESLTDSANWVSTDETVATVAAGTATGIHEGDTQISACQLGICSPEVGLTVSAAAVTDSMLSLPGD